MLPARLVEAYRGARKVVEVGAGTQWADALGLAGALGCEVLVADRDPRVLGAPAPLRSAVDDAFAPDLGLYRGAALLVAVRAPEDLQRAASGIAQAVGADLALKPLGSELAALPGWPRHERVEGWHWLRHG